MFVVQLPDQATFAVRRVCPVRHPANTRCWMRSTQPCVLGRHPLPQRCSTVSVPLPAHQPPRVCSRVLRGSGVRVRCRSLKIKSCSRCPCLTSTTNRRYATPPPGSWFGLGQAPKRMAYACHIRQQPLSAFFAPSGCSVQKRGAVCSYPHSVLGRHTATAGTTPTPLSPRVSSGGVDRADGELAAGWLRAEIRHVHRVHPAAAVPYEPHAHVI
jgi:hypothetical protein